MAHVDDLTLITAAQMLDTDLGYLGRPGDPDPDRRYTLDEIAKFLGGNAALITALSAALPIQSGSWTPELTSTGTPPSSVTYTSRTGSWRRVGLILAFYCEVVVSTFSGGTGNMRVSGIPLFGSTVGTALCAFRGQNMAVASSNVNLYGFVQGQNLGASMQRSNMSPLDFTLADLGANVGLRWTGAVPLNLNA